MNKKFLSAILFGALMVSSTGTFVSCKDYDDDIDSLQKQIDAQKALGDKLSTVETSIATLTSAQNELKSLIAAAEEASKKAAEAAQSAATAAGQDAAAKAQAAAQKFAEEAALKAQSAALEGAKKELETTKAALTELINKVNADAAAQTAAVKAELTASINKELATISGKLETVQTSLSESISKLDTTVDGLHATVGGLTVNVEDLNTAVDGLGVAVAALETESKTVSNQVNGLTEKLNEQIANTAKEIASLKEAMDLQEKTVKEYADKLNSTTLESVKANEDKILALQETTIPALVERIGALEDALDTLANLKDVTDLADNLNGLSDKVEGIEGDLSQLDADLKELIDTEVTKLSGDIQSINNNLDQVWSTFATGITHVSLVSSYNVEYNWQLNFTSITEQANIFGQGMVAEPLVFEEGKQTQGGADFIIRVSPTSADVTKDMITLQNSKGEKLDIVNIEKVEVYDKLLSRTVSKSGLFKVTAKLTEYDNDSFNAARYVDVEKGNAENNQILYAVSINNTKDADATREVVSSYDLTLNHKNYIGPSSLEYFVDNKNVDEINNRYDDSSISLENPSTANPKNLAPELVWKANKDGETFAAVAATNLNEDGTPKEDSNATVDDNRSDKELYQVVQKEDITISLKQKNDAGELVDPTDIRAMYVTLDHDANAIESAPSEWNAWTSYSYKGLDQIVEGTSTKISVSPSANQTIIKDVIGFRVYAVNYDGTLVDPDGRAFYVRVGDKAIEIPGVETEIEAIAAIWEKNPYSEVYTLPEDAFKGITGIKSYEWIADGINNPQPSTTLVHNKANGFKVLLLDENGKEVLTTNGKKSPEGDSKSIFEEFTTAKDLTSVVAIKTQFNHSMKYVLNDTELNGTLVLKDEYGIVIATLKVSAKKVMPTSAPSELKLTVKDNQIVNGVYNCYLLPVEGFSMKEDFNKEADNYGQKVASMGIMDMENVFNGWNEDTQYGGIGSGTSGYQIVLAETAANEDGEYTKDAEFSKVISIPAALIDNETEHATTVNYVYAGISTYVDENGEYQEAVDFPVEAITFKTIYSCYMSEEHVQAWDWKTDDKNKAIGAEAIYDTENFTISLDNILGTNKYSKEYTKAMSELNEDKIRVVDAKITSNISGEEDYFKFNGDWDPNVAKFTKNSTSTVPTADVPSTLTITYIDMYGHIETATLDFTVKKQ